MMKKLNRRQVRRLVMQEAKVGWSSRSFADVSSYAHDAGLYQSIGDLYQSLLEDIGSHEEATKWLRELIQDGVDSAIDDASPGAGWDDPQAPGGGWEP